jgi:protein PhnA
VDGCLLVCETCHEQIENPEKMAVNHWPCLNDSMWSQVPAVQVMAWRMLNRMKGEGWPRDLLDMLYLEDETLAWARATGEGETKFVKKSK